MQLFPIGIIKNSWEILLYDWLWLLFEELHTDNFYFVSSLFHLSLSLHFFLYLCGSAFAFPMIVLDHYYSVLTETGPYCINWLSAHTAITGNSSNITKICLFVWIFFPICLLSLSLIMTVPPVAFHGVYTGILCWFADRNESWYLLFTPIQYLHSSSLQLHVALTDITEICNALWSAICSNALLDLRSLDGQQITNQTYPKK